MEEANLISMLCFLYLIIFGILGIFSATHRELFFESLECIRNSFKRQPCETEINQKIKTDIIHKLLKRNPRFARFVNRNFELISWILVGLLVASTALTLVSLYDLAVHGSCTPGNPSGCSLNQENLVSLSSLL